MRKGQRLTISRSERFLGSHHQSVMGQNAVDLELSEEDVWSVTDPNEPTEESMLTARYFHGGEKRGNTGVTTNRQGQTGRHVAAASAPVKVPDWSKILKVDSMHENDGDVANGDWESEMVPPHEYMARKRNGPNGGGGSSLFLGVGRTLKGRDMRRVRDAVWSQTGFYG